MLASVLAPNPFSLAIFPDSAAARRSARLSILSDSCRTLIFLGPRPGTLSRARIPGGIASRSLSKAGNWPVVASCTIFEYIVSPIPGTSARLPSAIISERSAGRFASDWAAL